MKHDSWFRTSLWMCVFATSFCVATHADEPVLPSNVIFIVGDGMGLEHIKAGGLFTNGQVGSLAFESSEFFRSTMTTHNVTGGVTDSAASATAMATGNKVSNSVISMRIPGSGETLETLLESYQKKGRRVGLVTTANPLDATPAAFGAHEPSRSNSANIAADYLSGSRPAIIFGAATSALKKSAAEQAGYQMIFNRDSLLGLDLNTPYVVGSFKQDQTATALMEWTFRRSTSTPSLPEMATTALRLLSQSSQGFFLLLENEHIDEAGHRNDLNVTERTRRLVTEIRELDRTVTAVLDWARGRTDTLIVVVADHETGGLKVLDTGPAPIGTIPSTSWTTGSHTNASVGVFAWGPGAKNVVRVKDNTDIYRFVSGLLAPVITQHPQSKTVPEKSSVSFLVQADGSETLKYQWQKNGLDLPGETSATLTIPMVEQADHGASFLCRIGNAGGVVLSSAAILAVVPNNAPIAVAGDDHVVKAGELVILDGSSSSDLDGDELSYTWAQIGTPPISISHVFNSSITFTVPSIQEARIVTFRLLVRDSRGASSTDDILITIASSSSNIPIDPPPSPTPIGNSLTLNSGEVKIQGGPQGVVRPGQPDSAVLWLNAPQSGDVNWVVYDRTGRKVRTLIQSLIANATSSIFWDGTDDQGNKLPPGVYWCRVVGAGLSWRGKLAVID